MAFLRYVAMVIHLLMHVFREVIPNLVTFMVIPIAVVLRTVGEPMNTRRGVAIRLHCRDRVPIGERGCDAFEDFALEEGDDDSHTAHSDYEGKGKADVFAEARNGAAEAADADATGGLPVFLPHHSASHSPLRGDRAGPQPHHGVNSDASHVGAAPASIVSSGGGAPSISISGATPSAAGRPTSFASPLPLSGGGGQRPQQRTRASSQIIGKAQAKALKASLIVSSKSVSDFSQFNSQSPDRDRDRSLTAVAAAEGAPTVVAVGSGNSMGGGPNSNSQTLGVEGGAAAESVAQHSRRRSLVVVVQSPPNARGGSASPPRSGGPALFETNPSGNSASQQSLSGPLSHSHSRLSSQPSSATRRPFGGFTAEGTAAKEEAGEVTAAASMCSDTTAEGPTASVPIAPIPRGERSAACLRPIVPICPLTCFGFRFSKDPSLHPALRYSTEDYPHALPLYDGHTHTVLAALLRKERTHVEMRYFRERVRSAHDGCTLCLDWSYATHVGGVPVEYGATKYYATVAEANAAGSDGEGGVADGVVVDGDEDENDGSFAGGASSRGSRVNRNSRANRGESVSEASSHAAVPIGAGVSFASSLAHSPSPAGSPTTTASVGDTFGDSTMNHRPSRSRSRPQRDGAAPRRRAGAVGIDRWNPETGMLDRREVVPIRSLRGVASYGVQHADTRAVEHVDVGYGYNVLCIPDAATMAASRAASPPSPSSPMVPPPQGGGGGADARAPFGTCEDEGGAGEAEGDGPTPSLGIRFVSPNASPNASISLGDAPSASAARPNFSHHHPHVPADPSAPTASDAKAVIAIVPGLGSSSTSNYVQGWVRNATREGFHCVVAVARGLGDTPLDTPQPMCAAFTGDLHTVFGQHLTPEAITIRFGRPLPLILVGFSVGGAMSIKYLSEARSATPVHAAIAINSPWDFHDTANSFTRKVQFAVYGPDLAGGLGEYVYRHREVLTKHPEPKVADSLGRVMGGLAEGNNFGGIHSYDTSILCPIYGYDAIENIYNDASALQFMHKVEVPLLCFTCEDDPVTGPPPHAKRWEAVFKHTPNVLLVSCPAGGHMGYLMDPWSEWMERPNYMEYRLLRAIKQALRYHYEKRTRDVPDVVDDPPYFRYGGKRGGVRNYMRIPIDDWLIKLGLGQGNASSGGWAGGARGLPEGNDAAVSPSESASPV